MPTTLQPRVPNIRERIQLTGQGGTGKSNAVISIMRAIPDAHFHIIDNDGGAYNFLIYDDDELNAGIIERQNFTIHDVDPTDWVEQTEKILEVGGLVAPNDWFIFDNSTPTWQAVTDWYTHEIFEKGYDDYAIEMRRQLEADREDARKRKEKELRTRPLYDQFRDYGVINPVYARRFLNQLVKINTTAHVIITTEMDEIRDNDSLDVRKRWGPLKMKPRGQQKIKDCHFPHTALGMTMDIKKEEWYLTSVKDRGSRFTSDKKLTNEPWTDFSQTYLRGVAGWKKTVVR